VEGHESKWSSYATIQRVHGKQCSTELECCANGVWPIWKPFPTIAQQRMFELVFSIGFSVWKFTLIDLFKCFIRGKNRWKFATIIRIPKHFMKQMQIGRSEILIPTKYFTLL
jgi:hypothetical protein